MMVQKWKKINYILFIMSLLSILGCTNVSKPKQVIVPKPNGSKAEQIQFHKKEIERFSFQIQKEEKNFHEALTKHDMDKARESQNRRMQYQKKINKHTFQLETLDTKEFK